LSGGARARRRGAQRAGCWQVADPAHVRARAGAAAPPPTTTALAAAGAAPTTTTTACPTPLTTTWTATARSTTGAAAAAAAAATLTPAASTMAAALTAATAAANSERRARPPALCVAKQTPYPPCPEVPACTYVSGGRPALDAPRASALTSLTAPAAMHCTVQRPPPPPRPCVLRPPSVRVAPPPTAWTARFCLSRLFCSVCPACLRARMQRRLQCKQPQPPGWRRCNGQRGLASLQPPEGKNVPASNLVMARFTWEPARQGTTAAANTRRRRGRAGRAARLASRLAVGLGHAARGERARRGVGGGGVSKGDCKAKHGAGNGKDRVARPVQQHAPLPPSALPRSARPAHRSISSFFLMA
jgi:hypothetical protein